MVRDHSTSGFWQNAPVRGRRIRTGESYCEWIEDTDDPEFAEIRTRIEALLSLAPIRQRVEYEARLRSRRDSDFFSAHAELWYHDALERGGLRCCPAWKTRAGSLPDWCVRAKSKAFAFECYLRMPPEHSRRDNAVQCSWFDATFKKLADQRLRLWVHELTPGERQPSSERFAKHLDGLSQQQVASSDEESVASLGRHFYEDAESGWALDFTLLRREQPTDIAVPQLLYMQVDGAFWPRAERLLEKALSLKSRQHSGEVPVVICMAWNYFEDEPDLDEVCDTVAKKAAALESRQVCAVFWAREVYPWSPSTAPPLLLHWGSTRAGPLLASWSGKVLDVRTADQA